MNHSSPLLQVDDLSMRFGGLLAVDNVGFSVQPQEIFAIIGPNGAGKTTVFNCISGFYRASSGKITLENKDITGYSSHKVANSGIVRTFQNVRLFKGMTALENLLVAMHRYETAPLLAGLFNTASYRRAEAAKLDLAMTWLGEVGLRPFANRTAGTLAYGHQRRLEIARCMICRPRLLMLDEPAAGLNPQEKLDLSILIDRLRCNNAVGILLIEHDMKLVMGVSERILVMEYGKPLATGTPKEIQQDGRVIKAYLGEA